MVTKEQFESRLSIINTLTSNTQTQLDSGSLKMEALFDIITQLELQCMELRELASQHSREIAMYTGTAGLKLDGKPDRRWKAAKKLS
jgi:hypothetical protein